MTNKELIDQLSKYPMESIVVIQTVDDACFVEGVEQWDNGQVVIYSDEPVEYFEEH